jgi:hypothetical protein
VKAHANHPFHRVERWTGHFYEAVSLLDLGFTLNLGHGGRVCPNNTEEGSSDWSCPQFTILDSAGIFVHHVRWCRCNGVTVEDKHLQLVRARLFPSSITKPQTAFTFDVLDQFLIDALECKTSAMSFYQKLRRLTDNAFPNLLPVCFHLKKETTLNCDLDFSGSLSGTNESIKSMERFVQSKASRLWS